MAMSSFSADKDATWHFLQWVTGPEHGLFGAQKMDLVNPARASVWSDGAFRDKLSKSYPGYVEMHDASAPGASIKFTPQPLFFDLTTEWAATLQKMVAKEVPVDEGLDQLAESDPELSEAIADFRAEEVEHKATAIAHGAESAFGYPVMSAIIRAGCRTAIALSKRI